MNFNGWTEWMDATQGWFSLHKMNYVAAFSILLELSTHRKRNYFSLG